MTRPTFSIAPDTDARALLSSIAIGMAAIAVPASAQMTAPAPLAAAQGRAEASTALSTWTALRQAGDGLPFTTYADFLLRYPGWPGEHELRRAAERALHPDTVPPARVIAYFARHAPLEAGGWLRMAEAYDALGRKAEATAAFRNAWSAAGLTSEDAMRAMIRFAGVATRADHDARMERFLAARRTTEAQQQLSLTSPDRQPVFAARIAMQMRSPDAGAQVAATMAAGANDPAYLIDRAGWLRATGAPDAARAVFAAPRRAVRPPLEAGRWLDALWSNASAAEAAGDARLAFDIARQLDDAYPTGTVIRDRPLGERDDYTNLAFLAGQLAMNRLGRPADAVGLFDRYASAARTAQTQSKGLYFAGLAAQAARQPDVMRRYWTQAAAHFDQFYGQLAAERLGTPTLATPMPMPIEVSATVRAAFLSQPIVGAATLLGERGDWATQSLFVRAIAANAISDTDLLLASELAQRLGRPDLGVMVGRNIRPDVRRAFLKTSFPVVSLTPDAQGSFTIVHAIARQESQFDRKIVSRAGARGLMQLMPGTAREVGTAIGVPWGPLELENMQTNASLGSWYFGRLMDRFGGSYVLAIAAYNAGPGNVSKWLRTNGDPRDGRDVMAWIEAIPFKETRDYVHRVIENAVVYDQLNPRAQQRRTVADFLRQPRSKP